MPMQAVLGQPFCMQQIVCKRSSAMKCLQADSVKCYAGAAQVAAALVQALDGVAAALAAAVAPGRAPPLPAALCRTLEHLSADLAHRRAEAVALAAALGEGPLGEGGNSTAGRFEWVDGALTRAVEEGRWVLLDNAGACPATVSVLTRYPSSSRAAAKGPRKPCGLV